MIRHFDIRELDQLAVDLTQPGAAAELGILALCLVAAWVVVCELAATCQAAPVTRTPAATTASPACRARFMMEKR